MKAHNTGPKSAWVFGDDSGPTALDAHTVVFIARLIDAGCSHLLGDQMLAYGKQHLAGSEWSNITKGKSTLHSQL